MEKIFFEGLILQASLIFALGAQNIFILESGLQKKHHLEASFVCFVCDLSLILLGVGGVATIFMEIPVFKIAMGVLGVFFLFSYGLKKLVYKSDASVLFDSKKNSSLKNSILLALTFSLLNPHAFLDAFILIGGVSSKFETLNERLIFGAGAAVYSGIWFVALSSFAAFLKPIFENAKTYRTLMSIAGLFLIMISVKLGYDVIGWIQEDEMVIQQITFWKRL